MCICNLRYPSCNEHAPYCYLWSVRLYNIFPTYLTNLIKTYLINLSHKKKLLNIKCGLSVSLQLLSEKFIILRRTEQDMIKNVYWYSCKVYPLLSDYFRKNTHILNFMNIRPVGAELIHTDGRTDIHDEANKRLANAPENSHVHPWLYSYLSGQSITCFCGAHISIAAFTDIRISSVATRN